MVAVYEFLKEFDPYHPVWMNTAPRNSVADLRPYAATCDILGVDIYPVPYPNGHSGLEDKMLTSCGKYALRLQEIGGPGKSIFMWLQGFRWAELDKTTEDLKKRYPTKDEFRFMVFDTLLNGGNGFAIWGCQYLGKFTHEAKGEYFEDVMYPGTMEANALSALFCEGTQLADIKTSSDAVRCAVIRHCGNNYYFLLNLTPKEQKASITIPDAVEFQALGASRAAAFAQAGKDVQLNLTPYEVLIIGGKPVPPTVSPCPSWPADAEQHPYRKYFKALEEHNFPNTFCWIWDKRAVVSKGKCWAFREFDAPVPGMKTTMYVAIDDKGEVFFNGKKLAETSGWSNLLTVDLTPHLKTGKNIVAILGEDAGGLPCGILAQIRFGNQIIQTDNSWKTLPAGDETIPPDMSGKDVQKAFLFAPYGQGAWGKGVLLP